MGSFKWLVLSGLFSPAPTKLSHLGIGLAGGTAPLVATALIATTGDAMAPAWYLMLGSAIAAGAAFLMVDRSSKPLR